METHVLLGAEHVLTASNRMQAAAEHFARTVDALQAENLRHEREMGEIVAAFAEAVGHMR